MAVEAGIGILDVVEAQMVECVPPAPAREDAELPPPADDTPIAKSQHATIEQTGAGPPPKA